MSDERRFDEEVREMVDQIIEMGRTCCREASTISAVSFRQAFGASDNATELYRQRYERALLDMYYTGAVESLRVAMGDPTPVPWTDVISGDPGENARPLLYEQLIAMRCRVAELERKGRDE